MGYSMHETGKEDIQHVIFSDETRATLDGQDGLTTEWVLTGGRGGGGLWGPTSVKTHT